MVLRRTLNQELSEGCFAKRQSVRLGEVAIPNGHQCLHRRCECRGINRLGQILIKARRDGALAILRTGVG